MRTKSFPRKNYIRKQYVPFSGVKRLYTTVSNLSGMGLINQRSKYISPWKARQLLGYKKKFYM